MDRFGSRAATGRYSQQRQLYIRCAALRDRVHVYAHNHFYNVVCAFTFPFTNQCPSPLSFATICALGAARRWDAGRLTGSKKQTSKKLERFLETIEGGNTISTRRQQNFTARPKAPLIRETHAHQSPNKMSNRDSWGDTKVTADSVDGNSHKDNESTVTVMVSNPSRPGSGNGNRY